MEILEIVLTLVVLAAVIFAIAKKFNATTSLLCVGVITLIIYALVTGKSVMGDSTSGSNIIDVFELIKSKFAGNMSGTGLLIMSVMGFVKYMDHIKASKLLALYASRPLKRLGKPYIAVALGIIIGAVLKLCIPSHAGLTTLLMATLYPIFVASGVPVVTAASAVVVAGCFDLGPACPITTWACAQEPVAALTDVASFFVHYQLGRTAVMIAVTIVVFLIICRSADKKHPQENAQIGDTDPKSLGVPGFYAIFPVLPLVFVILFSSMVPIGIKISVPAANFIGFLIAFVVNIIVCKGGKKQAFNDTAEFWKGMGAAFTSVVALIGAASVFSAAINCIGGTTALMDSIGNSSLGGAIIVVAAALINFLMAFMTGSGVASSYAVLPMLYPAVEASGINLLIVVFAIVASGGLGRAISPVSGAVIIAGGASSTDVIEITKRTMIPVVCGFIAMVIMAVVAL